MNDKKYIIDIPELMKEWDWEKNKDLDPNKLVVGSEKKAWWICQKCKGTWQTQICVRKKHGCPYCTGQKVRKGINDFATLYPDLLKEWDWDKNSESGFFPDEIMPGTKKKIFWKCKECGFMWQAAVKDRTKKNGRATGCPQCKRKKLSEYHLTPVVGINDLESCYPEIAKEWNYDKNINLLPSQVLKGSATVVWWKCYICGNEWKTSVHSRTGRNSQTGCPSCSAQRTGDINAMPIQGENDLETLYPKLLKEWNYEKNTNLPSTYFAKSNKKVWWKCKYGHEWQASIVNRVKGRNCPICKKEYKVSFPEKTLYYYISKYYPDAQIVVLDSQQDTVSQALIIDQVVRMQNDGIPFDTMIENTKKLMGTARIFFTVGSLDYLRIGGRIGKMAISATGKLGIKPIIILKDGEVNLGGVGRNRGKLKKNIIQIADKYLTENGKDNFVVSIGYGYDAIEGVAFKDEVEAGLGVKLNGDTNVEIGVITAVHTGPHAIGIGVIQKYETLK